MMRERFRWAHMLPTHIVVGAATLGPIGRIKKAPGTFGSLAGVALYAVLYRNLYPIGFLLLLAATVYFAMAFCDAAERRLGMRDPGMIVLDEFVAVPIVFVGPPDWTAEYGGWPVLLAGFVLFRIFDILKPFGISRLQNYPGGIGCVLDDLAAAMAAGIALHLGIILLQL